MQKQGDLGTGDLRVWRLHVLDRVDRNHFHCRFPNRKHEQYGFDRHAKEESMRNDIEEGSRDFYASKLLEDVGERTWNYSPISISFRSTGDRKCFPRTCLEIYPQSCQMAMDNR